MEGKVTFQFEVSEKIDPLFPTYIHRTAEF